MKPKTDRQGNVKHPAKWSASVLAKLDELVPSGHYLDPFAGTGGIAKLTENETVTRTFTCIELEPEWARQIPTSVQVMAICTDSLKAMAAYAEHQPQRSMVDGVITSCVYGNRMSDSHNAKDNSSRRSYTHDLGRKLSEGSSGAMYFWQPAYKEFHLRAWQLTFAVTKPGGEMFLNVSDFLRTIREGGISRQIQMRVVAWHMKALKSAGYEIVKVHRVETPRMRHGENHKARVEYEAIIHARRP